MRNNLEQVGVHKDAEDGLNGQIWRFYLLGTKLVLDEYVQWSRPSKRHAPRTQKSWTRLRSGRDVSLIRREDVPYTAEIGAEAKRIWLECAKDLITIEGE